MCKFFRFCNNNSLTSLSAKVYLFSFFFCTHPRQRHRRETVPCKLRFLAWSTVTLTREYPRCCEGAHPHTVANKEDNAARHPGRRSRTAYAGARCRPDTRLDRPRRCFIPDLPFCENKQTPDVSHSSDVIGSLTLLQL